MEGLGTLLVLLLAVVAAHLLGEYRGRRSERARIFRKYGVRAGSELRRVTVEDSLRRSLGIRPKPADPESRPRQHRSRIRR